MKSYIFITGFLITILGTNINLVKCSDNARLNTIVIDGNGEPVSPGFHVATPTALKEKSREPAFRAYADSSAGPQIIPTKPPKYVTETVYGFLEFVTTIGSTVMVFTPQEEKNILPRRKVNISPSPTIEKVVSTRAPELASKLKYEKSPPVVTSSLSLEDKTNKEVKTTEPTPTGLAGLLRKALLDGQNKKKDRKLSYNSRPFRNFYSKNESVKKAPDHISYSKNRKPFNAGGSTIIPITIEGTGGPLPTKTQTIESPTYVPKEVVVSAAQNFPPVSVIGPFSTDVINAIENEYRYNHLVTHPSPTVKEAFSILELTPILQKKPRSVLHTATVYEDNGGGNQIQFLQANQKPFLNTPIHSLKSVIKGSATQFFQLDATASLPIESLFDAEQGRDARNREDIQDIRTKLSKRRGAGSFIRGDDSFLLEGDEPYDEPHEYDLQRSGSDLRPSFKPKTENSAPGPKPLFRRDPPRHRYSSTGTRNDPPPFVRSTRPGGKLRNRFRLGASQRQKIISERPQSVSPLKNRKRVVKVEEPVAAATEEEYDRIGNVVPNHHDDQHFSIKQKLSASNELLQGIEPLFENILVKSNDVATLPPINLRGNDLSTLLKTVSEVYHTTETVYKTSVLPVKDLTNMNYHTLTQTYLITRIVSALKTIPPVEAFEFIPGNSLNEFNDKLVAEGTEHEDSLLPEEKEYHENSETKLHAPLRLNDEADLANLAGGKFNPDVLERHMHPELSAAISNHKNQQNFPGLTGSKPSIPGLGNLPTPPISQDQLQMAYLRLMNPYLFGGIPAMGGGSPITVTSTPVVITTNIVSTLSRAIPVIFNDRQIFTTLTSLTTIRTTITRYETKTIAAQPAFPSGFGFPYPQPLAYAAG